MVKRRTVAAGLGGRFSNHTFRGTGTTAHLVNDGWLEYAQYMAGRASPKATKIYGRWEQHAMQGEEERIVL